MTDDEDHFVVDEDRAAVVSGPHSQEEAVDEAVDGKHIVLTRGAIELFAMTSSASLSWENEDVEEAQP